MSSAKKDSSLSQSNNTSGSYETLTFSAKEDVPPIILGVLIVLVNGLVLILVLKKKHLRTITNLLLCSLALSDLLTRIGEHTAVHDVQYFTPIRALHFCRPDASVYICFNCLSPFGYQCGQVKHCR